MVAENNTVEELKKEIEEKDRIIEKFKGIEEVFHKNKIELEQLNLKLTDSEKKFHLIFDSAIVGIAMTDNSGKFFILSNKTWNEMLGYTEQEMETLSNMDFTHPDDIDITLKYSNDLINDKIKYLRIEKRYITKSKSTIWVDLSISSIILNDGRHFFGIATDITQKKKIELELENLAMRDSLTGLLNRRAIQPIIDKEMSRKERYENTLSIMIIDLDFFKQINDQYGHQSGDEVLSSVANVIQLIIRETDSAARWGGEEFLLLVPNANLTQAFYLAEKIRKSIMSLHFEKIRTVTASIGIAELQPDENFQQWCDRADNALYRAKNEGRNCTVVA